MIFDTAPKGEPVLVSHISPAWGEMDAFGHMNHTRYFAWCEQARIDWLTSLQKDFFEDVSDTGPVVINAACNYIKQVIFPTNLEVRVFVGKIGRSSIETMYEIVDTDTGETCATSASKIVWVNYAAGKSVPLPEKFRSALEKSRDRG